MIIIKPHESSNLSKTLVIINYSHEVSNFLQDEWVIQRDQQVNHAKIKNKKNPPTKQNPHVKTSFSNGKWSQKNIKKNIPLHFTVKFFFQKDIGEESRGYRPWLLLRGLRNRKYG